VASVLCTCSEEYSAGCHQVSKHQQQPEGHMRNAQNFSSYLTEYTQRARCNKKQLVNTNFNDKSEKFMDKSAFLKQEKETLHSRRDVTYLATLQSHFLSTWLVYEISALNEQRAC